MCSRLAIACAIRNVWAEIGTDVLEAIGHDADSDDIAEFVLDADRLETFNPALDVTQFRQLPYCEQVAFARSLF